MVDLTLYDLLKGGGIGGLLIVAFRILIVPIIRANTNETAANRQERKEVILPMVKTMAELAASVHENTRQNQESARQNQESHAALVQTQLGLKSAVDILCQKANGGAKP